MPQRAAFMPMQTDDSPPVMKPFVTECHREAGDRRDTHFSTQEGRPPLHAGHNGVAGCRHAAAAIRHRRRRRQLHAVSCNQWLFYYVAVRPHTEGAAVLEEEGTALQRFICYKEVRFPRSLQPATVAKQLEPTPERCRCPQSRQRNSWYTALSRDAVVQVNGVACNAAAKGKCRCIPAQRFGTRQRAAGGRK